jgi:hypothetical protein
MATAQEVDARVTTHEAVCAERYAQINARLKRLERILMTSAGTMLVGMASLLAAIVTARL